jgi:hypothetical protein
MRKTKTKKTTSSKPSVNTRTKTRIRIPTPLRRVMLVECGHKCTIHNCPQMQNLEAHHINGDPSDNRMDNLIMLCPTHHTMGDRGIIDKISFKMYKEKLDPQQSKAEQILLNTEFIKNQVQEINNSKKSPSKAKRRLTK